MESQIPLSINDTVNILECCFNSVQSLTCVWLLGTHGLQHARLPCPSRTPRVHSDSCPLSQWYHLTISSSVVSFSSFLQSLLASGCFPMSRLRLLTSGGQSIVSSASVLPMSIQGWFPLGLASLISLLTKEPSRVLSSISVQKHQFFSALPSLRSSSQVHT